MKTINMHEAKTHLSHLIDKAVTQGKASSFLRLESHWSESLVLRHQKSKSALDFWWVKSKFLMILTRWGQH